MVVSQKPRDLTINDIISILQNILRLINVSYNFCCPNVVILTERELSSFIKVI